MSEVLHEEAASRPRSFPARIGKYQVLRSLAQGGMAEIFLASSSGIEGFEKLCVIKRILPQLSMEAELVSLFLDEARLAASLQHSNIAQVFDVGTDAGRPYFVMELLRGEDLHKIMKTCAATRRTLPFEHVVTIITGVCAGLHHAHELRRDGKHLELVHRDISPQNIFVTWEGGVKLCDFGIAKSTDSNSHTRTGTIRGKIHYMSPEQVQLERLDRRSDVFSLSIVLWELLTMHRLFSGKNDLELFKKITLCDVPAPSTLRAEIPAELDAIVMRGLRPWAKDRYQNVRDLQIALEEWSFAARVPASPLRLAGYMTELYGATPATVEDFMELVTEGDPLATRIRGADHTSTPSDSDAESEAATTNDRRQESTPERSRTVLTSRRRVMAALAVTASTLAVSFAVLFGTRWGKSEVDLAQRPRSTQVAPAAITAADLPILPSATAPVAVLATKEASPMRRVIAHPHQAAHRTKPTVARTKKGAPSALLPP